ncbi:hypothetical protein C6497_03035 [Candidatus Poribacteria bacterium]|nr:MAG: hypothetical protein C6497_03035 [Candidatus Poribacteria bacterium]
MYPSYKINPDWSRLAKQIVKSNQTVIVIGTTDSGKSTFCRYLIDFAYTAGLKVGFVDTDVGQSQIGPPTTIGMKIYEPNETETHEKTITDTQNASQTTDLEKSKRFETQEKPGEEQSHHFIDIPDSLYFVGDTSPHRNLLYVLSGTQLMVEAAHKRDADFVVLDTSGYLHVSLGWQLKQQKIELIRPQHIVCIGRKTEFQQIVGYNDNFNHLNIHYLLPHKETKTKNRTERIDNRNKKFARYFNDATIQQVSFDQIRSVRTLFFNGRIAKEKEIQMLTDLADIEIDYAEWGDRSLNIITRTILSTVTTKKIKDYLSLLHLNNQKPDFLNNLLVGMLDEQGNTIGIGVITSIDFKNHVFNIRCKHGHTDKATVFQFSNYHYTEIEK